MCIAGGAAWAGRGGGSGGGSDWWGRGSACVGRGGKPPRYAGTPKGMLGASMVGDGGGADRGGDPLGGMPTLGKIRITRCGSLQSAFMSSEGGELMVNVARAGKGGRPTEAVPGGAVAAGGPDAPSDFTPPAARAPDDDGGDGCCCCWGGCGVGARDKSEDPGV